MKRLFWALSAVVLVSSCMTWTRNAVWEPALEDEAMVVLFIGLQEGWQTDLSKNLQFLTFSQIAPEFIGPLPPDQFHAEFSGVFGGIYVAANLPTPGIYKIANIVRGWREHRNLYVQQIVSFPSVGTDGGPMVNVTSPGVHFMGSFLFVNQEDRIFEPLPAITEKMVLQRLAENLAGSKPSWAAKIRARLQEVAQ